MSTARLQHRRDLFWISPTWAGLGDDEREPTRERLLAAQTYAELAAAEDRALLRAGVLAVSATGVESLGVAPSGDWAAIDEALDADDEVVLEAALDTVGVEYYGPVPLSDAPVVVDPEPVVEDDDGTDLDPDAELEAAEAAGDDGWVGL